MIEQLGRLLLSPQAQRVIGEDLMARVQIEACGVLLGELVTGEQGDEWLVDDVVPLRNIAGSPVYFEFDPGDLLQLEMERPGQIIGVYHSHPTGYARASRTDQQNMARVNEEQSIPWCWLIVCGPFNETFAEYMHARGGVLPEDRLIAYYHYPEQGLAALAISLAS
jgi:proteasome lid subunit RPN8/RPN11